MQSVKLDVLYTSPARGVGSTPTTCINFNLKERNNYEKNN